MLSFIIKENTVDRVLNATWGLCLFILQVINQVWGLEEPQTFSKWSFFDNLGVCGSSMQLGRPLIDILFRVRVSRI